MPGFLVILFWLWLAVSLGIYLYRFLTKGSVRPGGKKEPEAEPEDRYAAFEAQLAAMPAPAEPVTTDAVLPDPGTGFDVFAANDAAPAASVAEPAVAAPVDMAMPESAMATPPTAVAEMPAPEPVAVEPTMPEPMMPTPSPEAAMAAPPMPGDAARARSLAEALEGIEMPAELVPVRTDDYDPRHMQFYTDTFAPADVGMSLADELERLGFAINPISDTAIRVDQNHASVEVRILPDLPSIQAALGERAGSMTPETVVVDFQLC